MADRAAPASTASGTGWTPGPYDHHLGESRGDTGQRERRLATAGCADDGNEPACGEELQALRDRLLTTEEQVGVLRGTGPARIWAAGRIRWRATPSAIDRHHLVHTVEAPQHVRAQVEEVDAGWSAGPDDVGGRCRRPAISPSRASSRTRAARFTVAPWTSLVELDEFAGRRPART